MWQPARHIPRERNRERKKQRHREIWSSKRLEKRRSSRRTRGRRIPVLENVSCRAPSSAAVSTTSSWFYGVLLESKGAFYPSAPLRCKKKKTKKKKKEEEEEEEEKKKKANRGEAIKRTEPRELRLIPA